MSADSRRRLGAITALVIGLFLGLTLLPLQWTGPVGGFLGHTLWHLLGAGALGIPLLGDRSRACRLRTARRTRHEARGGADRGAQSPDPLYRRRAHRCAARLARLRRHPARSGGEDGRGRAGVLRRDHFRQGRDGRGGAPWIPGSLGPDAGDLRVAPATAAGAKRSGRPGRQRRRRTGGRGVASGRAEAEAPPRSRRGARGERGHRAAPCQAAEGTGKEDKEGGTGRRPGRGDRAPPDHPVDGAAGILGSERWSGRARPTGAIADRDTAHLQSGRAARRTNHRTGRDPVRGDPGARSEGGTDRGPVGRSRDRHAGAVGTGRANSGEGRRRGGDPQPGRADRDARGSSSSQPTGWGCGRRFRSRSVATWRGNRWSPTSPRCRTC